MIIPYNHELISQLERYQVCQQSLAFIHIGADAAPINDKSHFSTLELTQDSATKLVNFVAGLSGDTLCFVNSPDFGLMLAVIAAWNQPKNLSDYIAPQLKNQDYYNLMRDAIVKSGRYFEVAPAVVPEIESPTSLFNLDGLEARTIVVEHDLDPSSEQEFDSSLEDRFLQIMNDFNFTRNEVIMGKVSSEIRYILFKNVSTYTREVQQYLKKNFAWMKEYFPDIWSYDSVLIYLADYPFALSNSMSRWIIEHPEEQVDPSKFA